MIHMDNFGAVAMHNKWGFFYNIMAKINYQVRSVHGTMEKIMVRQRSSPKIQGIAFIHNTFAHLGIKKRNSGFFNKS